MNAVYTSIAVISMALLLIPRSVEAEDLDLAEGFRLWLVDAIDWRPERGVSLTTVEFARKHARSYRELRASEKKNYRDGLPTCSSPRELADKKGLVLFQTASLDIFAYADQVFRRTRMKTGKSVSYVVGANVSVCLFQRGNPIGTQIGYVSGDRRYDNLEFFEATGSPPLELKANAHGSCGSNCGFESIKIFALDSNAANPILRKGFGRDYHENHSNLSGWNLRIVDQPNSSDEQLVLEYHPVFLAAGVWLPPRAPYPYTPTSSSKAREPLIREKCQRPKVGEKMSCEREVVRRAKIDDVSPFLQQGVHWRQNARAIIYLIEHQDELRKEGFDIEQEFIERLRKHLPESMQDRDE